jgi:hypothetical protein
MIKCVSDKYFNKQGEQMDELGDNKYWGKKCRHNHVNEDGLSMRYIRSDFCVECDRNHNKKYRSSSTKYQEYQAAYHKRLRVEHPERLAEYYKAREETRKAKKDNE